jgi:hypothetical protein
LKKSDKIEADHSASIYFTAELYFYCHPIENDSRKKQKMSNDIQTDGSNSGFSSIDSKLDLKTNETKPENFVIHTMKKDLKNPEGIQYSENIPDNLPAKPALVSDYNFKPNSENRQRTSPFLSQSDKLQIKTYPTPAAPSQAFQTTEKIKEVPVPHTPSSWSKLVLISIVLFLIIASVAGGYYFWINKNSSTQNVPVLTPEPAKSLLAADKPNYLNIDIDSSGKINLIQAVDKYIKQIQQQAPSTPTEFIIADNQNNPISLKNFASASGITLPTKITNALKETFSLFIYLDDGQPHLGIVIDSNDLIGSTLKDALKQNESEAIAEMAPLYTNNTIIPNENPFETSYYGGAEIRYKNIDPNSSTSLDYTIFRDKLIISTSKMTLRSIIDYITANTQVKGVDDVIGDIPEEMLQNNGI